MRQLTPSERRERRADSLRPAARIQGLRTVLGEEEQPEEMPVQEAGE